MNSTALVKFLQRSPVEKRWSLQGRVAGPYKAVVIIPALAESKTLFHTLSSLTVGAQTLPEKPLVVVVVNQRVDATTEQRADNQRTLRLLIQQTPPYDLTWVDASSPGCELPATEGVGMARRIGMDLALPHLTIDPGTWIACLDADTLVEPSYWFALCRHFRIHRSGGAVLNARHQPAPAPEQQKAIDLYETYLQGTALGLAMAGSPYAYISLGSAIACSAEAYIRSGGMNRRLAGEDFYFLQQLRKTSGLAPVQGTCVFPSARISQRTPFGTGPKLQELLHHPNAALFYHPQAFDLLRQWLQTIKHNLRSSGKELLQKAYHIDPCLRDFLAEGRFVQRWDRMQQDKPADLWLQDVHTWFDGLQTIRLLNHLSATDFPRGPANTHLTPLLKKIGQHRSI